MRDDVRVLSFPIGGGGEMEAEGEAVGGRGGGVVRDVGQAGGV
jgi:hypothetical protein